MQSGLKRCCQFTLLVCAAGWLTSHGESAAQLGQIVDEPIKLSARYHIESGTDTGFLIVKVEVPVGNHIYSLNQSSPLKPSKIVVERISQFTADTSFKSDRQPTVIEKDQVFKARVEKFSGTVQFYVPIKVDAAANPDQLKPKVVYSGQVCSDLGYCVQVENLTAKAEFAGYFQREAKNANPLQKQQK